jgi:hypothetical protein
MRRQWLVITRSTTGTADEATEASWHVDYVAAEVAQLRARGVQIQDLPSWAPSTASPTSGFALAAWFTVPHHNSIGLLQLKEGIAARTTSARMRRCCHGSRICSSSIRRAA